MKLQKKSSEVKTFDGQTLEKPLPYTWEYQELEAGDPFEPLTEEEQRAVRTREADSKARQAAEQAAKDAAGLKKRDPKTDEGKRVELMVKFAMMGENPAYASEAEAEIAIRAMLGLPPKA